MNKTDENDANHVAGRAGADWLVSGTGGQERSQSAVPHPDGRKVTAGGDPQGFLEKQVRFMLKEYGLPRGIVALSASRPRIRRISLPIALYDQHRGTWPSQCVARNKGQAATDPLG